MKLLIVDNYDSFTYNLYYYFCELGVRPQVVKNDFVKEIAESRDFLETFDAFVLSPGFGGPSDSGVCRDLIREFSTEKKILGVCLGCQCIASVFGGVVCEMPEPIHGKSLMCECLKNPLTDGLGRTFKVGLYHSLYVSDLGECEMLGFIRKWDKKIPMIIRHRECLVYGIQFHPESILQEGGKRILKNFLKLRRKDAGFKTV